jgi:hypothetical protein
MVQNLDGGAFVELPPSIEQNLDTKALTPCARPCFDEHPPLVAAPR